MSWHGHRDLMVQLGPELAKSFAEFALAQNEEWAKEIESGEIQAMGEWLENRWGSIFVPENGHPGSREIIVYERTGQYCGAFRYDPDTRSWTDMESGFTHPDPEEEHK